MKPTLAFIGPINSLSGYGVHARMVARALVKLDKWEIHILRTNWGVTPNTVQTSDLDAYVSNGLQHQPEISVQVALPSEFRKIGKYSIGVTAVTETHVCPASFMEGSNKIDLVLVPSEFSKLVLGTSVLEMKNPQGQITDVLKCQTPIETVFEGIDLDVFNKKSVNKKSEIYQTINQTIPENFCYLFVGHWLDAPLGHDRKDVGMLVKTFMAAFKDHKPTERPALILKTSTAGFSYMERDKILQHIDDIRIKLSSELQYNGNFPNVYVINGDLSDSEMNDVYNHHKVKCFVTFTKGEGYCLPLAEFSTTGKPIIASNHSGHLDFVHASYSTLLPGKLEQIHPRSANEWLPREGHWFTVSYPYAMQTLRKVYENYPKYLSKSQPTVNWIGKNFSFDAMVKRLDDIMETYTNAQRQNAIAPMTITLPKLTKPQ